MTVIPLVIGLTVVAVAGCGTSSQADSEELAVAAGDRWLELVDSRDYSGSWQEAAEIFKSAVTREGWVQTVENVRKPLGAVISREVRSKSYSTTLPGAPDGEYVVIQYSTEFENKRTAVETVTPLRESDGTWRVSGYYVK